MLQLYELWKVTVAFPSTNGTTYAPASKSKPGEGLKDPTPFISAVLSTNNLPTGALAPSTAPLATGKTSTVKLLRETSIETSENAPASSVNNVPKEAMKIRRRSVSIVLTVTSSELDEGEMVPPKACQPKSG